MPNFVELRSALTRNFAEVGFDDFAILGRHVARQLLDRFGPVLLGQLAPAHGDLAQFLFRYVALAAILGDDAIRHRPGALAAARLAATRALAAVAIALALVFQFLDDL